MSSETYWRGVPVSEVIGAHSPWDVPEFPIVKPSQRHTVLYNAPANGRVMDNKPPQSLVRRDKWEHDYVRMPCSSQSLYPVEDNEGQTQLKKRWEMIVDALSKPITNSKQLADAILSYNTKFKGIWKFRGLHELFNEYLEEEESRYFFDVTLPDIANLALSLPKLIQAPIPLLRQNQNNAITLSQQQISCLLANAFFCTFPRRTAAKRTSEYASYPFINFDRLYEISNSQSVYEKLKCLCHYFRRVTTKVPVGVMTFKRRSVPLEECPDWAHSDASIAAVPVHVESRKNIEDTEGLIHIDFANKYLGGGVIGHGCVQEEIRFVICPELIVSMLFTEVLKPEEALLMIGCERYSSYMGYGNSFVWAGDYEDRTPYDSSGRRRCALVAIDALPYHSVAHEYTRKNIVRELNKAWVGFTFYTSDRSGLNLPGVATGNWGCGAFGGTPELKSLIQLMACAQAKRPMAYYTFSDTELRDNIVNIYNLLSRYNVKVGQLYKYIIRFSCTDVRKSQLHSFIHQAILDDQKRRHSLPSSDTSCKAENMDFSVMSVPEESLVERALNESPDLFSQDDTEYLTRNREDTVGKTEGENETSTTVDQVKSAGSEHTSRLFVEMRKLDSESGLNLESKASNAMLISTNVDNEIDVSTNDSENLVLKSSSSDIKKRMSKKITDYFCKKS